MRLFALLLTLLMTNAAFANNSALIFRRDVVTILPTGEHAAVIEEEAEEPIKLSKKLRDKMAEEEVIYDAHKDDKKSSKKKPKAPKVRTEVKINAEIRSDQTLKLEWIASLNRLRPGEGVMIMFDPAIKLPLLEMNVYDPVDVLLIDREGNVMLIAPDLSLYGLQDEVMGEKPARAWFFLKGGEAERLRIHPGDRVQYPLFNPRPTVLE